MGGRCLPPIGALDAASRISPPSPLIFKSSRKCQWGGESSPPSSGRLAPGAQPLDPTYHRAIHWTPSVSDSKICEPPDESPSESNSQIFESPYEPTAQPHELPSAPYRVRLEYINIAASQIFKNQKSEKGCPHQAVRGVVHGPAQ